MENMNLTDLVVAKICGQGFRDYVEENFEVAYMVAKNNGSILDLDRILHLNKIWNDFITWEAYQKIFNQCDEMEIEIEDIEDKEFLYELLL